MNCVLCPNDATEKHHLWPTALGGPEDGFLINLCGNCHTNVHKAALRIYRGLSLAEFNSTWLNSNRTQAVINRIVQAYINAETADLSDAPKIVYLQIDKKTLERLHRRKIDLGFTSVEQYLRALLMQDLPPTML